MIYFWSLIVVVHLWRCSSSRDPYHGFIWSSKSTNPFDIKWNCWCFLNFGSIRLYFVAVTDWEFMSSFCSFICSPHIWRFHAFSGSLRIDEVAVLHFVVLLPIRWCLEHQVLNANVAWWHKQCPSHDHSPIDNSNEIFGIHFYESRLVPCSSFKCEGVFSFLVLCCV